MAESLIGIRIILVEDHDDCREIFATMLRVHGAVVTAVANAREAIGIVAHADIVVTRPGCRPKRRSGGGADGHPR